MATIQLLHVSDLHIARFLNIRAISKQFTTVLDKHYTFAPRYSPGKLSMFAQFLRARQHSVDGVIITGDIATTGRKFDLESALEVVENTFVIDGVQLCLLPGNHDRWTPHRKGEYSALRSLGYDPGGRDFHDVFRRYWGPEDVQACWINKDPLRLLILAADFSLRRPDHAEHPQLVNKHGQGRAYWTVLDELERATLAAMSDETTRTVVIWAVHFPPFCPDIASDMKLIGEADLVKRAAALDVLTILAGHSHVPNPYPTYPEGLYVFCAGTLTEYNPVKNQFFIISLEDLGTECQVQLENYEFDPSTDQFTRKPLT